MRSRFPLRAPSFAALVAAYTLAALSGAACDTTVNLGDGPDSGVVDSAGAADATTSDSAPAGDTGAPETSANDAATPVDSASSDSAGVDAADAGPKGIFVSRATYTPDFGGILQADKRCQESANAATLTGKWKAWISDSQNDAADRFLSNGPWIAVISGVELFPNKAALRGFPLAAPTTDELGKTAPDNWWTGTLANGIKSPDACSDWITTSMFVAGMSGTRTGSGVPGKEWTENLAYSCSSTFALLCLEDQ